ncbi:MAG: sterol desaturase family protein [Haliea sp.]|nr:sterol desaturase family protein [Haliea sp.]
MMNNELALQPVWDFWIKHLGDFVSSPGLILAAVILGVYVPGVIFSIVDVFVTKRLSLRDCCAVYWRAMKWYSPVYIGAILFFAFVPLPFKLDAPASAPTLIEFFRDILFYFLVGDFASYVWHRIEHANDTYAKKVHYYHHTDRPPLTIWTAMVVHPVEGFSVFLCFHIYGILFPIHPLTFAIAAFSITAVTMITHCGYRIPVYDKLFANAACHDLHHANRAPTNVSVVLTVCDRLFGTYQKA